jgi:TIR domain
MKVFISHKKEDQRIAVAVGGRLEQNGAQVYLDLIDPDSYKAGDDLADYLRAKLSICTDLMAVVSAKTKESWWVPWEIGVASEKEYPLSTFAGDSCEVPLYLKKWPYLRSMSDIDTYVKVSLQARRIIAERYSTKTASALRPLYARQFHSSLKQALGQ